MCVCPLSLFPPLLLHGGVFTLSPFINSRETEPGKSAQRGRVPRQNKNREERNKRDKMLGRTDAVLSLISALNLNAHITNMLMSYLMHTCCFVLHCAMRSKHIIFHCSCLAPLLYFNPEFTARCLHYVEG